MALRAFWHRTVLALGMFWHRTVLALGMLWQRTFLPRDVLTRDVLPRAVLTRDVLYLHPFYRLEVNNKTEWDLWFTYLFRVLRYIEIFNDNIFS